jgi:hypothetical protein
MTQFACLYAFLTDFSVEIYGVTWDYFYAQYYIMYRVLFALKRLCQRKINGTTTMRSNIGRYLVNLPSQQLRLYE